MAKAVVIAAPSSGSGKTVVTLGILRALRNRGLKVASAKVGPDYIDPRFHEAATGRPCFNLDPWAMQAETLSRYMQHLATDTDIIVVEGVMGLFDGPQCGGGSTADLARAFDLPIALVIDCSSMAQSVSAIIRGFSETAGRHRIPLVILNRIASDKHERILRSASHGPEEILGAVPRDSALVLPSRHLGLVPAGEHVDLEAFLETAARIMAANLDLDSLLRVARTLPNLASPATPLEPLGRAVAIASDNAFAFAYPHLLHDWRTTGARLLPFSPLADEPPSPDADSVFLPGGYPELHAKQLAGNRVFLEGLKSAAARCALIYGECGGFMVLGEYLVDDKGARHMMAGLLPLGTSFAHRKLHLGYRTLNHQSVLPFPAQMRGHEFHYSTIDWQGDGAALFECQDVTGASLPPAGLRIGNVMGSYAHIIA